MISAINKLLPKRRSSRIYLLIAAVCLLIIATFVTIQALNREIVVPTTAKIIKEIKAQSTLLDGQWSYMPGATRQDDGLHIVSTGLAIVEQDGSGGQANPPINLYGSHLENAENFVVGATIKNLKGNASLQLYGEVPIIADEFRIERKSVRITLGDGNFQAMLWDGSNQKPVLTQSWKYSQADSYAVSIRNQAGKLAFSINGHYLGTVDGHDIFRSKTVWMGMDANQSWLLSALTAKPLDGGKLQIVDSSSMAVPPKSDGLQQLLIKKRNGLTIGAAMALGPLVSDPAYAGVALSGNFGSLTTENALKWQFVHPQENLYTFQEGDALVALARKHNMKVHGHALVFGEANPGWVNNLPTATQTDRDRVKQIMLDHITKVAGHYKGKVATWDVVNEPLADYDNFDSEDGRILRSHKWYQAMGQDYIAQAFQAAHAADPDAKLFMNEYGLEEDGDRWDAFYALVSKLKSQGVPINGVGFQSHVYESGDRINGSVLKRHMQQLANIGVESRVSENDVYSDQGQAVQASQYGEVFSACLSQPSCISYTTWGVSDRYNTFRDDDGSIQYGEDFLWSDTMAPTPAVTKLQSLLN